MFFFDEDAASHECDTGSHCVVSSVTMYVKRSCWIRAGQDSLESVLSSVIYKRCH